MGFFSRLGQMVDGGLSKLDGAVTNVASGAEAKLGHSFIRDAEHGRQHQLFASGSLAKLDKVLTNVASGAEAKLGRSFIQDAEHGRQHQLFASVNGGETVHSVSFPVATPSSGKAPKVREI